MPLLVSMKNVKLGDVVNVLNDSGGRVLGRVLARNGMYIMVVIGKMVIEVHVGEVL